MPGITGQGQTYNLPNYHGDLFAATPADTPFLSAIGGLTGGKQAAAKEFEWQGYDLRSADQNTKKEGADAPDAETRVRFNVSNIVQIHQEAIDVSYTRQATQQAYAGLNVGIADNPVINELDWQIQVMLKQVARDVEYSFVSGTYAKPTDNTTARKTRGLLAAIASNVIVKSSDEEHPAPDVAKDDIDSLLQMVYDNGGISEQETATLITNSYQKRKLTAAYATAGSYREQSRTVGGLDLTTIETDFGTLNVMLDRFIPQDTIVVASLEQCAPVFLEIPGKGFLFVEPLAKTGASDRVQLYGEIGLEYGNEKAHGKITGLKAA